MSMSGSDLALLTKMYENAGALQKQEIEQRYKLGKSQIQNAMKIAQMESKDKRYGIEVQRELGLANIAQAREEMERIGIPEMEIKRFVADKNYELALAELALKREVDIAGLTGMYDGEQTLAGQEQNFRQAFDTAKLGAELGSTPDTYFQARRFAANDLPRLMGQGTQYNQGTEGSPVPGVARMGEFLGQSAYAGQPGAQPPATPYGGQAPQYSTDAQGQPMSAAPAAAAAATTAGGATGPAQDERAKQIAQIAKAVPPSPYDGLDESDAATLRLMESVYKKGGRSAAGGEMERLAASGRIGFLRSAGNVLGYSPQEFEADYAAYRPAQSASNLA